MKGFFEWRDLFPHDPRPSQVGIMDDIATCVKNRDVAFVEGSNGIGKTLASLSAGLASSKDQVIFATRTHSQIQHVVNEFKKINKKARGIFQCVVLGARQKLCLNPWVQSPSVPSSSTSYLCKTYVDGTKCKFEDLSEDPFEYDVPMTLPKHLPKLLDLDALVEYGRHEDTCPYFTMKQVVDIADLVITPYNFVFSEVQQDSVGLSLADNLLIVDEGHNTPDIIKELTRQDLSLDDLRQALVQLTSSSIKSKCTTMLIQFRNFLKEFPDLDARRMSRNKTYAFGEDFIEYLKSRGFTKKWMTFIVTLGHTVSIADDKTLLPTPILKVVSFFSQLISGNPRDIIVFWNRKTPNKSATITLGLKMMDATPTIQSLLDQDVDLVFMSGTLSPIPRFSRKLGIARYKYSSHVSDITEQNLRVFLLERGINGHVISTKHDQREKEEVVLDYGETIKDVLTLIPNGSLIFFPSYKIKQAFLDSWMMDGIVDEQHGRRYFDLKNERVEIFQELRGINFERETLPKFSKRAKEKKAVLMAVIRGRSSEGIDFPHELSRCIFIIGVPFKNTIDPEVRAEMEYYDRYFSDTGGIELTEDAMAMVNQSIGRGIRDPKDYCVAYLLDARYIYRRADLYNALSPWIGKNIAVPKLNMTIANALNITNKFFDQRHEAKN